MKPPCENLELKHPINIVPGLNTEVATGSTFIYKVNYKFENSSDIPDLVYKRSPSDGLKLDIKTKDKTTLTISEISTSNPDDRVV